MLTRTEALPYLRDQSILIDDAGRVLWTYDKSVPVPLDEAFVTIAGPGRLPVVDTPYGRMSAAICYDTYFPALIRQADQRGVTTVYGQIGDLFAYLCVAGLAVLAGWAAIRRG